MDLNLDRVRVAPETAPVVSSFRRRHYFISIAALAGVDGGVFVRTGRTGPERMSRVPAACHSRPNASKRSRLSNKRVVAPHEAERAKRERLQIRP